MTVSRVVFVSSLLVAGACTVPNPDYCDETTPCTDPDRPYCDLTGEIGGTSNSCVPDPGGADASVAPDGGSGAPDAAPPDADCSQPEICDGIDNDCDMSTDEDFPLLDMECVVGIGACERTGMMICTAAGDATECSEEPGTPADDEICGNGEDDDCDESVDEGCVCTPSDTQNCGTDVGECEFGTQTCTAGGTWGSCEGGTGPVAETCNDLNDDCDSFTDEDFPTKGMACTSGLGECMASGNLVCNTAGTDVECDAVEGTPTAELCDGLNNDCDTETDEDFPTKGMACTVGLGECMASGTFVCNGAGSDVECDAVAGTPTPEVCDGLNNDCDTETDEGCPDGPIARFPWRGHMTGSVWATDAALVTKPRRPTFRWSTIGGATSYELEVDDSCTTPGFDTCAFPSPEITTSSASTEYAPTADLAVSLSAPVGRRYYWRVRACDAVLCGFWSEVSYVDVGRQRNDFDGDGYADILVGAPPQSKAYVYYGSASGTPSTPGGYLTDPAGEIFPSSLAGAGDLNGDGYADAIAGTINYDPGSGSSVGAAFLFYGASSGLLTTPDVVLVSPVATDLGWFGDAVTGAGDLDGDGYGDIVVGAPKHGAYGAAYVYYGTSTVIASSDSVPIEAGMSSIGGLMGTSVAGLGDVNGDGYADMAVGAPSFDNPENGEGSVFVFRGGVAGVSTTPDTTLDNPDDEAGGSFGWSMTTAGDVNGDGYWDLMVGAPYQDAISAGGSTFVFHGSSTGLPASPEDRVFNVYGQTNVDWGIAVAGGGDFDNDGYFDVMIGAPRFDYPEVDEGIVVAFIGAASGVLGMPAKRYDNPLDDAGGNFGGALACAGDINGDGYADFVAGAYRQSNPEAGEGNAFVFYGADILSSTPGLTLDNPEPSAGGWFGQFVGGAF